MAETGFALPVFLFFGIIISSLGWQILIKGTGTVDNLWTFGLMISTVFLVSGTMVTFFPFSWLTFFISVLIFLNFSTLYVYSFPKSILPNWIWLLLILTANILSIAVFMSFPENSHAAYFITPLLFSTINVPIILRKIKYLEPSRKKASLIHVSFITALSLLFPLSAGISSILLNPSFFLILIIITVPVSLILFGISSYFNINTGSGISRINFPIIFFISAPSTVLLKNLFSLRTIMLNYVSSVHFTFTALFLLFILLNITGILISMFSSLIEGFINRSRHFYQKYITKYKTEIEKVTSANELFVLFNTSISSWFREFRSIKYFFFTDEFSAGQNISFYIEPSKLGISVTDKNFLHEPYFVRNSVDFPPEMAEFAKNSGANIFVPIVYKNELTGFIAVATRKFSHSAMICIYNILELTMNRFEKLYLFTSVLEAEKKVETLKHFQETGKMVSIIAHELRSPLSSIMFNLEVIKDSVFKKKDPDPEYLDISLKEIRRLNETVEKMLDYGRSIKLTPKNGLIKPFFDEVSRLFPYSPEQVAFTDDTGGYNFYFDWDMLKSVMINLISNSLQAIERSKNPGLITIRAYKKRNKVHIEVADTGPGIPEEHRNSIFEPFYTTRKEGNGLGLATAEKIVKLSGGTIILKETSQKGTTFRITLPFE